MAGTLYLPTDDPFTDPATGRIAVLWLRFLQDVQAGLSSVPWASIDFTGSSFADILTRSASVLNTGTLPLGRLSGITTTQLAAAAGITGSQLAAAAGITGAQLAAAAGITFAQLASMTDARLVGRSAGSNGVPQEIAIGAGLALAAGTLSATGTGSGAMTLLYANSGTDASAGATTVDSIAISGLTLKDTIVVELSIGSQTQATAAPLLYNVTDSVSLGNILAGAGTINAGAVNTMMTATFRRRQDSTTRVVGYTGGWDGSAAAFSGNQIAANFTTVWTGNWTLGLRHGGVTAGGTFIYNWSVYKLAGQ